MSYLVLARKSRPQTFSEVVGQKAVVKTLQNSILRERIAHAILFSGVRGVGKTTLARIMAKAINCEADVKKRPCNKCTSCKDISKGHSLDVLEIDGASNNGVDDVRTLRENIKAQPAASKYKIVIIDEVHMLSTSAFNALLKTLEEPPAHVYFMFATTEIHKIPITILSRCQQYELKKVSAEELNEHFARLTASEGYQIDPAALSLITREAGGSIRDGLSLLDQMFSYGENEISLADVVEVLGLAGRDTLLQISLALLGNDKASAFDGLLQILEFGVDLRRFLEDLLTTFRNLFFCSSGCSQLVDVPAIELKELQELASKFPAETIHLKLKLLMDASERVQRSSQPRFVLETAFMQIIEASNVAPLSAILAKLESLLPEIAELEPAVVQPPAKVVNLKSDIQEQGVEKTPEKKSETEVQKPPDIALKNEIEPTTRAVSKENLAEQVVLEEPDEINDRNLPENSKAINPQWPKFLEYVAENRVGLASVLRNAASYEFAEEGETILHLHYENREECHLLSQGDNFRQLQQLALDFFGKQLTLQLHQPEKDDDGGDEDSPRARRNRLAKDPLVRMTEDIFHGQVGAIRLSTPGKK